MPNEMGNARGRSQNEMGYIYNYNHFYIIIILFSLLNYLTAGVVRMKWVKQFNNENKIIII
jgi:hypothetical protein